MFGPNAKFFAPPFAEGCPPQEQIHNGAGAGGGAAADGSGADWASSSHSPLFHRGLQSSCAVCSGKQSWRCHATLSRARFAAIVSPSPSSTSESQQNQDAALPESFALAEGTMNEAASWLAAGAHT